MKIVLQKDGSGCGLACAAMVAGITYFRAKRSAIQAGIFSASSQSFYTSYSTMQAVLKCVGVRFRRGRRFSNWKLLRQPCIVGINLRKDGAWHWVLFQPNEKGGYVLDPHFRHRRRDFGKMKAFYCLPLV